MSERDDEILEVLQELLVWTRFASLDRLTSILRTVLADARHAKAYELSDGKRSQSEVAKGAGLSQPAVSTLWGKWRRLGIVRNVDGRVAGLVRPSDVGIMVSESDVT